MKAIIAMSENRAIGKNGGLPWPSIREDFKWFKEFTMGQTLIMGRTTYNTLPPLKGRKIVVLTRDFLTLMEECILNPKCEKTYTRSYKQMVEDITSEPEPGDESFKDAIVAGGAKTYEFFLPYITEFYVTHVKGTYEADTFMVPFEHLFSKSEIVKEFDGHKVIKYSK